MSAFILLFLSLSSLYYYKERSRYFQEQKTKNRIIFLECKKMNKIFESDKECEMQLVQEIKELQNTMLEITIAFFIFLLVISPLAYILAMISLHPMRESIKTIDGFINGIIHDINTPLSAIKLNAQSIDLKLKSQLLKDKNKRILQAVDDIESLEEQLLFSLTSDKYVLNKSIVDLSKLLKEREFFYNDVRNVVKVLLEVKPLNINIDSAIFTRMIDNIVLNAIKFSHRNSEIIISIKNDTLIVEDFGIGIKDTKNVFVKYYREDNKTRGIGLGLFIVDSVAKLHNIDISIESKIGVGTRFIIDLKTLKVS